MKTGFPSRDSEEEPQNIIEIRPYKKTEEQDHTGHLGILHKLVARFAAGFHLVEEEEHVSAVQCGDRKNVHEGKDDGKEGGHVPELVPVPRSRENASDSAEAAQLFGSFFREEIFHVADVSFQCLHTQRYACGERFKECVYLFHHRQQTIRCQTGNYAHQISGIHAQGSRIGHTATHIRQRNQTRVDAVFQKCFGVFLAFRHRLLENREGDGISVFCVFFVVFFFYFL